MKGSVQIHHPYKKNNSTHISCWWGVSRMSFNHEGQHYIAANIIRFYGIKINTSIFVVESLKTKEVFMWLAAHQGDIKVTLWQNHDIQWKGTEDTLKVISPWAELAGFMDYGHCVKEVSLNHRWLDKDLMVTRHLKL